MFSERMRPAEGPTVPWCWQGVMGRAVWYNTNLKAWVLPQKLLALWSRQLLNLGFVFSKTGSCSRWDPGAGPAHPSSALLEAGTSPQLRLCPTWEVTAPFRPPHTAPAMTDCHRKGWIPGPGGGGATVQPRSCLNTPLLPHGSGYRWDHVLGASSLCPILLHPLPQQFTCTSIPGLRFWRTQFKRQFSFPVCQFYRVAIVWDQLARPGWTESCCEPRRPLRGTGGRGAGRGGARQGIERAVGLKSSQVKRGCCQGKKSRVDTSQL